MEYVRSTLRPSVPPAAAVEEMDDGNVVVVADGPRLGNFPVESQEVV